MKRPARLIRHAACYLVLGALVAMRGGLGSAAEPGVTADEILLGTHAPLSGPAARYGAVAQAAGAYFDHINDQGGVHGRRIRFVIRDDGFRPDEAERVVRQLVTRDRVFAIVGGFGDAPHSRVADYLNYEEIPDLFPTGGSSLWSSPLRRWTIAFQPTYRQEGWALAAIAARDHAGSRAAVFAMAGEMGHEGAEGFRAGLKGKLRIVQEIFQDSTDGKIAEIVEGLRNGGVRIMALFTPPGAAARFMAIAGRKGWRPVYFVTTLASVPELIRRAGRRAFEEAIGLTFLPLPEDEKDPRVGRHREILARHAPDISLSRLTLYGQALAELTVEVLRRAGPRPTRDGVIKAAESLKGWNDQGRALVRAVTLSAKNHLPLNALRTVLVRGGRWRPGKTWVDISPAAPGG
ncbi:MAG: ABC transporter substrate-binding protein [SAR324 cluster bacterium]|nr:ABC transporter substrate-binding protein [SAR324 cluster bacterium]